MGVLKYLNHTTVANQVVSTGSGGSGKVFLERAHLVGTGISTLTLYDGGPDLLGRVMAVLSCAANTSDDVSIQDQCPNGVYAVMTTGAGISKAVIYDR